MLKIATIFVFIFLVSSAWSACDSCGSECASACGTRRFRACCFNYLRRKRGPDAFKKIQWLAQDMQESQPKSEVPVFLVSNVPTRKWTTDVFSNDNQPYYLDDMLENRLE
ncbi:hypothetical protein PYW08_012697 [Mythimna loreyi]|uniref:Uncharacterized protein n=1 Tax=Mythimna loreyi TaxID=667449 RepID=A0ACC2Q2R9_9NEOP|nr:hypothetical protein PYW08_012697 [Mythimna loreyi]